VHLDHIENPLDKITRTTFRLEKPVSGHLRPTRSITFNINVNNDIQDMVHINESHRVVGEKEHKEFLPAAILHSDSE